MDTFKEYYTVFLLIPLVFLISIILSARTRWPQFKFLKRGFEHVLFRCKKSEAFKLSSVAAISIVLGGNIGVGNIAGIAVALKTGGPGSLFWMFVMAFICAILKYAGTILAMNYKVKGADDTTLGGPMYYIKHGLSSPIAAKVYSFIFLLAALTGGNFVQINSIVFPLSAYHISPFLISLLLMGLVAVILFGGLKRFVGFVNSMVPGMAVLYLGCCAFLLTLNYEHILPSLGHVVTHAFGAGPFAGGVLGYSVFQAISSGFDRGLFATDAGLGLAPIVHAGVHDPIDGLPNSISQGIISLISPILVPFICLTTGLTFMVTGVWLDTSLESTTMAIAAFQQGFGHGVGGGLLLVVLFCFAITTILTWAYCAEKCVAFLWNHKKVTHWRIAFIAFIPIGSLIQVSHLWRLADYAFNALLIINSVSILLLSQRVVRETRDHAHLVLKKERAQKT